jgi:hypothetical protein
MNAANPPPQTFAIETLVGRAGNYLDNMADKDGQPYTSSLGEAVVLEFMDRLERW